MTLRTRAGFTLVELLVAMVITLMVGASIVDMLRREQRLSVSNLEEASLQSNLRVGIGVLTNELRSVAVNATFSDITLSQAGQIRYRAMRALGFACSVTATQIRVRAGATDPLYSVNVAMNQQFLMLFVEKDPLTSNDDTWLMGLQSGNPTASTCPDGQPALALTLTTAINTATTPLADIKLMAPVRSYEEMEITTTTVDGQNWLAARQVQPTAGTLQIVAGPLQPQPAGLQFEYLDQNGNVTATPTNMRTIRVTLRGQTSRAVDRSGALRQAGVQVRRDSVVASISLRNAPRS